MSGMLGPHLQRLDNADVWFRDIWVGSNAYENVFDKSDIVRQS